MEMNNEALDNLELAFSSLKTSTKSERAQFLNKFLSLCSPSDLAQIDMHLNTLKCDFIYMLPNEVVENILRYLDWKSVLNCCQVSSRWNEIISKNFNNLWLNHCLDTLPINEFTFENTNIDTTNFKHTFVDGLRQSSLLEKGCLFRNWSIGPAEINALAVFEDTIATATHIVRFWRLEKKEPTEVKTSFENHFQNNEDAEYEWTNFSKFELMSRALQMRFDKEYLLTTTYFLTLEVYSRETGQCLQQLVGHTCQITCFDFDRDLKLIVTGSADYTLKYWSLESGSDLESNSNNALITSESNNVWPVRILITKYDEETYFVFRLSTQGTLYVNSVQKIADFQLNDRQDVQLNVDTFNFKSRLLFGGRVCVELDAQLRVLNNHGETDFLPLSHKSFIRFSKNELVAYLVTENNPRQENKMYIRKWLLNEKDPDKLYFESRHVNNKCFNFLNKLRIESMNIKRYEVISFGLSYCIFVDDDDRLYICNLKNETIKCLQDELGLNNQKLRIFQLSTNVQEQFIFTDRHWLDGFDLGGPLDQSMAHSNKSIAFSFFTQRVNEVFAVLWRFF